MNYTVKEVLKNVYQIQEPDGFSSTLVIGSEKALVFDTMSGRGDLKSLIKGMTDLPLVVVNSHGHYDHIGGNIQFDQCYMHKDDWNLLKDSMGRYPALSNDLKLACEQACHWLSQEDSLQPIWPGEHISLGNLDFEVISLKGHTSGSIGLYCASLRLLLSGDAFTPQTCLFFPESLSVKAYIETIHEALELDFEYFIAGHQCRLFSRNILRRFRECAYLAEKKGKSMLYEYSLNPAIKGQIYILDVCDPEIQEMICIIDKY